MYWYCCRLSSGRTSRGGGRQSLRGQGLTPSQQLLVLLLTKAWGHLSGWEALLGRSLGLLCCLRLASTGGVLAIATAWGHREGDTGVGRGGRKGGIEFGRVWHCGGKRVEGKQKRRNLRDEVGAGALCKSRVAG